MQIILFLRYLLVKISFHRSAFIDRIRIILKLDPPILSGEFDINTLPSLLVKKDPVILDIGCNDGNEALQFLKLFTNPMIYAFDPEPRAIERFKSYLVHQNVRIFELAISSTDGTTTFHISNGTPPPNVDKSLKGNWFMSGSIKSPKDHLVIFPWCKFNETIQVKTKKLDTWCQDEGVRNIDFIWADVQGAEEDLILGAKETLNHTRYLYTEYNNQELYEKQPSLRKILKLLPDFEILQRYSYDVLLKNKRYN